MDLIIRYLRPYYKKVAVGMSVKLVGTIIELFIPYILAYIIDSVTPLNDRGQILIWGFLMLLCSLTALVSNIFANRNAAAVARHSTENLRHDLFEKIIYLSNRQVDQMTIPSLISRMTTDTYIIHRMVGMMQRIGVRAPIMVIGGIFVTLTLDPVLAGILVLIIPIIGIMVFSVSKKALPLFDRLQSSMDEMVRIVRENAAGIRVIKALSKTEYEMERFDRVNQKVVEDENRAKGMMALNSPIMNMLLNTGLVLIIIAGAYRVDKGLTEVGKIMAFLTYFTMILHAVMGITRILTMYGHALAAASRLDEVMDSNTELVPQSFARETSEWHIEFSDVSFSYEKIENNLSNISFGLKRGESLGIIGSTGAGKSTIAYLLMRLYDIDQGHIRIGGKDIRSMEIKELRSKFGVVFQNDAVFKNTIGGNIKIGRDINQSSLEQGSKTAQAYNFIMEAGGFAYNIEAGGTNLSGGQKQRLLISRALAGNPEILILDDSSSALDYKTDMELRKAIKENYAETTTIIIAQRVSSVRNCDKILLIEEGRIEGYASHDQLIENNELYIEISNLQASAD